MFNRTLSSETYPNVNSQQKVRVAELEGLSARPPRRDSCTFRPNPEEREQSRAEGRSLLLQATEEEQTERVETKKAHLQEATRSAETRRHVVVEERNRGNNKRDREVHQERTPIHVEFSANDDL